MTKPAQETLFQALQEQFATLKDEFQRLDLESETYIKHWRYAEESAFELRAAFYQRFNTNVGRLVDDEPESAFIYYAYGYDIEDRIRCTGIYQGEEPPRSYTFYNYGENDVTFAEFGVELYTERYHLRKVGRLVYSPTHQPIHYADYVLSEGLIQRTFEQYHYDRLGRIEYIRSTHQSVAGPVSPEARKRLEDASKQHPALSQMLIGKEPSDASTPRHEEFLQSQYFDIAIEEHFKYEDQILKQIVVRSHPAHESADAWSSERIVYEAPKAGETIGMIYHAARASLYTAVIDHLLRFDPDKRKHTRFYCLTLSYDAVADDGLLLTLGLETHRELWQTRTKERSYRSLIYDSLHSRPEHIEIWDLPNEFESFRRANRREQNWGAIRQLLNSVARELNDFNWNGILNTTGDFIIFASDYEALEDPHDEIRACVPEYKLRILQAKKLLD